MPKRAENHDGSCREIISGKHAGKWRVQFTAIGETGQRRRVSKIFRSKSEAKEALRQMRHGNVVTESKLTIEPTLGEWFSWLAENDWPESIAAVTIAQRKARFTKYAEVHFGKTALSKIDALQVRAFYRLLRENGASKNIVMMVKSDLVRAFNQAVTPYQRVPSTLANPFRLAVPRPQPREAVVLTPEQINQALSKKDLCESSKALLAIFLLSGLRLGEVMAIRKAQFLFNENLIIIDRAIQVEYGGKQIIGLPKGGKKRSAVMCECLRQLLEPVLENLDPESLVWPSTTGNKPKMKKRFYALWKTSVMKAGLPGDLSPHDCRLSHINIIEKLMPSVSLTTLKEHIGHAAQGVTEVNYTRPLSPAQTILRSELDRVFKL